MHTLHLGLLYTANGGTMQLGCTTGKFFHLFMISEETVCQEFSMLFHFFANERTVEHVILKQLITT